MQTTQEQWITDEDGRRSRDTATRIVTYAQYGEGSSCAGKWCWQVRDTRNWQLGASGIVDTDGDARDMCEKHAAMSDDELIDIAASEHLKALALIGYKPRTSIQYAAGYNDGFKAALEKMREFLDGAS